MTDPGVKALLARSQAALKASGDGTAKDRDRPPERPPQDRPPQDPPQPGDLYVLTATSGHDVEWVVTATMPADSSFLLLTPADGHFLSGSSDVELEDTPLGPLVVRCRFGTWIHAALLDAESRAGVLAPAHVRRVRQRWLDLGGGRPKASAVAQEVDDDPAYRDWIDDVVVPACQALVKASEAMGGSGGPTPGQEPGQEPEDGVFVEEAPEDEDPVWPRSERPSRWMSLKIAAGVAVTVGSLQFWLMNAKRIHDLDDLRANVEHEYKVQVDGLSTENAALKGQRDTLQAERDRLAEDLRNVGGAVQEAESLRQQIADLDRRLADAAKATEVVNPEIVVLDELGTTTRGRVEVTVRPGRSHVMLTQPLGLGAPAPRYKAELTRLNGTLVWANDELVASPVGELWFGIPASALSRGRHILVMSERKDGELVEVGRYFVDVSVEE